MATRTASPPSIVPQAASITPTSPPPITPTSGGGGECYFVWATHDLPEQSDRLNSALKAMASEAGGSAYAYGEDCVQADGTRTFSAMETDFRVKIAVADLADKESLGNWISKTMTVILALPASELQGPGPGRVELEFNAADAQSHRLNVDIAVYKAQGAGLQGARLFEFLDAAP